MRDLFPTSDPGRGRISEGPTDTLIERTLEFVRTELAAWRDDPQRTLEEAEERLNAQLCKYLNVGAIGRFPMVHFHHEEKQTGIRRVDISALPNPGGFIGQTYHTIYDPFLVFEGKRLPAPAVSREREYVTGGAGKSGGIQRFKLGLHGAKQDIAAMIGYVQARSLQDWHSTINQWIRDLANGMTSGGDEKWYMQEQLADLSANNASGVSRTSSSHERNGPAISSKIRIEHIWIKMQD